MKKDKSENAPGGTGELVIKFKHPCPYCETGWAWGRDGGCSCRECSKPTKPSELHPMNRDCFEMWTEQSNKKK